MTAHTLFKADDRSQTRVKAGDRSHAIYIVKADDRSHAAIKAAGPLTCYSKRMTAHKQESKRGTAHTLRSKRMTAHTPPSKRGIAHTLQSKRKTAHTLLKADDRSYASQSGRPLACKRQSGPILISLRVCHKNKITCFYHKFLSSLCSFHLPILNLSKNIFAILR